MSTEDVGKLVKIHSEVEQLRLVVEGDDDANRCLDRILESVDEIRKLADEISNCTFQAAKRIWATEEESESLYETLRIIRIAAYQIIYISNKE